MAKSSGVASCKPRSKTSSAMRINVPALGRAIREKRRLTGINQSHVAEHVGVAQGVVSRIENGYGGIDGDLYARFCSWLGVSLDTFVQRSGIADAEPSAEAA